jgi:hypothetical protein
VTLPWQLPALCGPSSSDKQTAWTKYLQGFRRFEAGRNVIFADYTIDARALERLDAALYGFVRQQVSQRLGLDAPPPPIYVHASVEALRKYSCVNDAAVAFYDGSIHLADLSKQLDGKREMLRSLLHEYTHHVLMTHGIHEPVWLQEGLAMHVARESYDLSKLTPPGIDIREMSDAFPHTAPAEYAQRFYRQAFGMVSFLHQLCNGDQMCGDAAIVQALTASSTTPTELFSWSIQQMRPRANEAPLALWQTFLSENAAGKKEASPLAAARLR